MANGTINGTTANQYIVSKIEWSSTPSTAKNNSTVTASLYYRRTNYYTGTQTGGTGTFTITINGQSGSVSANFSVPNSGAWVYVCSVTKTVAHNADGTKSITISATGGISGTTLSATKCSGTATLDNIPRQATITSAPDFTDEQNPTITYSNPAGSAVSALRACISFDGVFDDIAYRTIPAGGSSYTFNLTEAERDKLRNATASSNSRFVVFIVRTTFGGVSFNSLSTKKLSIVNANPTFTDDQVDYTDTNEAITAITGNPKHIVQNQSSLTATIGAATANKGANITGYTVSLNGVTKTASASGSFSFGAVNSSQDVTLSVTAKDSRGNTTTVNKKVTVFAWSQPVLNATVERLNNYEDETYLTADASISSVNGKNTMAISYQYKQNGGSFGSPVQISNKTQYTIECDKNYAYVFSITVTDLFDSTTKEIPLANGKFPMFIDTEKNAVGINEFPSEGEALRVAGGIARFEDGVQIGDVPLVDFIVAQGTSGIWTYRKWNSGIAECRGIHVQEDVAIDKAWGNLFESKGYVVNLPSGLFVETPQFSITLTGGGGTMLETYSKGSATQTPNMSAVRPFAMTVDTVNTSIVAYGRWK